MLLLCTTDPLLKALQIVRACGFAYKMVGFYWAKLKKPQGGLLFDDSSFFTGLGFWTRANPEMCLLAIRGKPKQKSSSVKKLVIASRREHSRKPDGVYAR